MERPVKLGNLAQPIEVSKLEDYLRDLYRRVNLVTEGTAAPTIIPQRAGDFFIDRTNGKTYQATGVTSSADWKLLNEDAVDLTDILNRLDSLESRVDTLEQTVIDLQTQIDNFNGGSYPEGNLVYKWDAGAENPNGVGGSDGTYVGTQLFPNNLAGVFLVKQTDKDINTLVCRDRYLKKTEIDTLTILTRISPESSATAYITIALVPSDGIGATISQQVQSVAGSGYVEGSYNLDISSLTDGKVYLLSAYLKTDDTAETVYMSHLYIWEGNFNPAPNFIG